MKVRVFNTSKESGAAAAKQAAEKLNAVIAEKGSARLLLSTGASQFKFFEAFVKENVDWSKVEMFHLDEYVGISEEHPASFQKYLKEKGIVLEESKAEYEHIKCDNADMAGKYATGLGMMEIKQNNKNELVTKVSKIPIRLCLCEDGFYQCMPVKAIHKIPVFKRSIQGMRLKPATYMGEDIMLFEQAGKYHKTANIPDRDRKFRKRSLPDFSTGICRNLLLYLPFVLTPHKRLPV